MFMYNKGCISLTLYYCTGKSEILYQVCSIPTLFSYLHMNTNVCASDPLPQHITRTEYFSAYICVYTTFVIFSDGLTSNMGMQFAGGTAWQVVA